MGFALGLLVIYLYIIALPIAVPVTALVITAYTYFNYDSGLVRVLMVGWSVVGTLMVCIGSSIMYIDVGMNWVGTEPHPNLFDGAIMMIPVFWTLIFFS